MPLLANAKKALRVSRRKAERNQIVRSKMKTMLDKAKKESTIATLSDAFSAVDKAVKKHLLHQNKAARIKSQLSKLLSTVGKEAAPAAKPAKKAVKKSAAKKSKKK